MLLISFYLTTNASNFWNVQYSYTFKDGCGTTWRLVCNNCTSSSGFADAIDNWKSTHRSGNSMGVPCYSTEPTVPPPLA